MKASSSSSLESDDSDDDAHARSPLVGFRMAEGACDNEGRTKKTKKKQIGFAPATTTFTSGGGFDEWNDSALVNAYNVAIKSYTDASSKKKNKTKKSDAREYLTVPAAVAREEGEGEERKKREKKKKKKKTVTANAAEEDEEEEVVEEERRCRNEYEYNTGYGPSAATGGGHYPSQYYGGNVPRDDDGWRSRERYPPSPPPPHYPHYPPRPPSDYYAYPQQHYYQHNPYYPPPALPGQYYSNPYEYATYTTEDRKASNRTRSGEEKKTRNEGDRRGSNPFHPPDMRDSALRAAGNDEELANLLLAWYYAGYYTGQFRRNRASSNRKSRAKEEGTSARTSSSEDDDES